MASQLLFVFADNNTGKIKQPDRGLIRSRCMQGRNKKPNSRRSLRAARQSAHRAQQVRSEPRTRSDLAAKGVSALEPINNDSPKSQIGQPEPDSKGISARLPQRCGALLDLEIVQLIHHDSLIYPREFIFNCEWSNQQPKHSRPAVQLGTLNVLFIDVVNAFQLVKGINSPVFSILSFSDMKDHGAQDLVEDVPFRHAVALKVLAYKEYTQQRELNPATYMQYRVTLALLNARLSSAPEHYLIDTTMYIINVLASIAVWFGRLDEINTHIRALKHIIRLRGGRDFLVQRPFMRYHLQCLDLASSMSSGDNPGLGSFDDSSSASVPRPHGLEGTPTCPLPECINRLVDQKVASVYASLKEIEVRINGHWARKQPLEYPGIEQFSGSILSRLLALKDSLEDDISECFRLGLLAFMTLTMYRAPDTAPMTRNTDRQFAYLTSSYRRACRAIEPQTPRSSALVFWLLTISAMSVFGAAEEDWLVEKWHQVAKILPGTRLAWEDARVHLEGVLWIRAVHDDLGEKTYTQLMKKTPSAVE